MEASEYIDRLGALKDCSLTELVRIRTASEQEAKSFTKEQKEERRRYKRKIEEENQGTDFIRIEQEQATWAFWNVLKNKISKEQMDEFNRKKQSEDKE